jgi:2,4-dienoyl-CoA reductase-like NADH-dependent reductase (Old Yellow Enzyme family)
MRFLLEVYSAMRAAVGPEFPVGVKLNSADFQKGGFAIEEAIEVAKALDTAGIDMIEVSGGTYESPVVATGVKSDQKSSTKAREAYFAEYARLIRSAVKTPVMLTGGFRTDEAMLEALTQGDCDVVGLARSLVLDLQAPAKMLRGESFLSLVKPLKTGINAIDSTGMMEIWWYGRQMTRISNGKAPRPSESPIYAFIATLLTKGAQAWATRKLRAN